MLSVLLDGGGKPFRLLEKGEEDTGKGKICENKKKQTVIITEDRVSLLGEEEVKLKRFEMERDGAIAEVVMRAMDAVGHPLPDADVHLYFTKPKEDAPEGFVRGKTDVQGVFATAQMTTYRCLWEVSKEGFHSSSGDIKFSSLFSDYSAVSGKWTKDPVLVDVVLKEQSGAELIHGDRIWHDLKYPTNTWVGFDFCQCDFVAPYGKGQIGHIAFRSKAWGIPPFSRGGTYAFTNTLEVKTYGGGLAIFEEELYSSSPFMSIAPDDFAEEIVVFSYARTKKTVIHDGRMKKGTYLVFKTRAGEEAAEDIPSHFGIIRQMEFSPGMVTFEYFFNPKPDDRRIDGNINSQSLHGK